MKGYDNMQNNKSPTILKVDVRIPNHIVKVPKEVILQQNIPEHRISALFYLNYNRTWENTVNYSSIHMIQWCGYKANWNRHKNRESIYDKFLSSMKWLFSNGYVIDFDASKFTQNTLQSSLLNLDLTEPNKDFAIVYDFEYETIMKYDSPYKPLTKSILLLVFSYIKAFMWIRFTSVSGHSEKTKKSKPEIFHSQFETMSQFIGIKPKMISKATEILEQMGLIKTHRMPRYQDFDGQWHTDDIIYLIPYKIIYENKKFYICSKDEYNPQKELENGIIYLRNMNHISKKFYQE
uniref:Uncharacterized protein n=1 Tax=Siphoviridae sp. ctXZx16 TaxID=2826371 RepID=A0A8S5MKT1_9CAUD|nr:MAG TPA: hypothetical protein [Siphoviridae sp. ctXZx16]